MSKILVVDDEASMRRGISDNLEFEGFEIAEAANGFEALEKLQEQQFDLLVLDVMMPKMSGFDVCKQMRQQQIDTPVIFLTAKGEEIDKVLGLELGADDYMTKPFSIRELSARIKAILRRTASRANASSEAAKTVQIGALTVDFDSYMAHVKGEEVKLSHKEFEVLHYLYDHRNKVVSREDLLSHIWKYDEFPTTRTVDNFILRLRQKIEINPNEPKLILTVHGMGYKLLEGL